MNLFDIKIINYNHNISPIKHKLYKVFISLGNVLRAKNQKKSAINSRDSPRISSRLVRTLLPVVNQASRRPPSLKILSPPLIRYPQTLQTYRRSLKKPQSLRRSPRITRRRIVRLVCPKSI